MLRAEDARVGARVQYTGTMAKRLVGKIETIRNTIRAHCNVEWDTEANVLASSRNRPAYLSTSGVRYENLTLICEEQDKVWSTLL